MSRAPSSNRASHIDPRVGTLLNLALCEEKRGRLVQALERWQDAADLGNRLGDDRSADATKRATELLARLPKLTLELPADAPADAKVRVEFDTHAPFTLTVAQLSKPVLVDPGKVTIVVEANGSESRQTVDVAEAESKTFGLEVPAPGTNPVSGGPGDDGTTGLLIAGLAVGGLGIIGLGVGLGFGGVAAGKWSDAEALDCPDACRDNGKMLTTEASDAATVSTALSIAGGIVAAVGITLIVISVAGGDDANPIEADTASFDVNIGPTGASAILRW